MHQGCFFCLYGVFTRNLQLGFKSGHFFWWLMNSPYTQLFKVRPAGEILETAHTHPWACLLWNTSLQHITLHCSVSSPDNSSAPSSDGMESELVHHQQQCRGNVLLAKPQVSFSDSQCEHWPSTTWGRIWKAGCVPQTEVLRQPSNHRNTTLSIPHTAASQQQTVFPFSTTEMNYFFTVSTCWLQNCSLKNLMFRASVNSRGTRSWETKSTRKKLLLNFC